MSSLIRTSHCWSFHLRHKRVWYVLCAALRLPTSPNVAHEINCRWTCSIFLCGLWNTVTRKLANSIWLHKFKKHDSTKCTSEKDEKSRTYCNALRPWSLHKGSVKFCVLDFLDIYSFTLPKLESRRRICLFQCYPVGVPKQPKFGKIAEAKQL